jgi:hypothetical protein
MSLREELKELISKKDALELEIKGITEALNEQGVGGPNSKLVDKDGFPRSDIDVSGISHLRSRLASLAAHSSFTLQHYSMITLT